MKKTIKIFTIFIHTSNTHDKIFHKSFIESISTKLLPNINHSRKCLKKSFITTAHSLGWLSKAFLALSPSASPSSKGFWPHSPKHFKTDNFFPVSLLCTIRCSASYTTPKRNNLTDPFKKVFYYLYFRLEKPSYSLCLGWKNEFV